MFRQILRLSATSITLIISYNMGTCALPDIHALTPRVCGPRGGVLVAYIRQRTHAHVITTYYIHH